MQGGRRRGDEREHPRRDTAAFIRNQQRGGAGSHGVHDQFGADVPVNVSVAGFGRHGGGDGRNGNATADGVGNGGRAWQALLRGARASGALSLRGRQPPLTHIPADVFSAPAGDASVNYGGGGGRSGGGGDGSKWWELASLRRLDVSDNALTCVPDEVSQLLELEALVVSSNQIGDGGDVPAVPRLLSKLPALKLLDLSHNQLMDFIVDVDFGAPGGGAAARRGGGGGGGGSSSQRNHPSYSSFSSFGAQPVACVAAAPFASLTELLLSHNRLSALPPCVCALSSLVTLDVSSNALRLLDARIRNLSSLRVLRVSNNALSAASLAPAHFQWPARLETLELANNELSNSDGGGTSASLSFEALTGLRELDLRHNHLRAIPSLPLHDSTSLVTLQLGYNDLTNVAGIGRCVRLSTLVLNDNALTELASPTTAPPQDCVSSCASLTLLDVSNNNLRDLPPHLGSIASLRKIVLSGNSLTRIPSSKRAANSEELKRFLRTRMPTGGAHDEPGESISLSHMSLASAVELPLPLQYAVRDARASGHLKAVRASATPAMVDELCALCACHEDETLTVIDVSGNQLTTLSAAAAAAGGVADAQTVPLLRHAATLVDMQLSRNALTALPPALAMFCALRELSLAHNQLTVEAVDSSFANMSTSTSPLPALVSLDVSHNRLRWLPPSLLRLHALEHLSAAGNGMTDFPPTLESFPRLRTLDVSTNSLTAMPAAALLYRTCPQLELLNVENNNLSSLPPELGACRALKTLQAYGNPQRSVPPGVVNAGGVRVLAHLRNRIPDDSPVWQVVGDRW
jgi:Leucine-rich repeat (LRR) protein